MTLLAVIGQVVAVVAVLHVLCLLAIVGTDRLRTAPRTVRRNARAVAPVAVLLGVVLAVNGLVRDIGIDLSWLIGINITGYIYALEGQFVAELQSLATPSLTAYFSFVYVFGYVFLLTFPVVAYAVHDHPQHLRATLVAYILNYGLGLISYILFIAYGPRNFMPELVESLLYTTWPQAQLLTSQVNTNTNVFPSLHSSLSVTVALLAYRTRELYPGWTVVATFLAGSIVVSTMYLGIHWLIDVLAGVGLAAVTVSLASAFDPDTAARYRERIVETRIYAVLDSASERFGN